jgi:hypothetical protein
MAMLQTLENIYHIGQIPEQQLLNLFPSELNVFAIGTLFNLADQDIPPERKHSQIEKFSLEIEGKAVRVTVVPINGSEKQIYLDQHQKEIANTLLISPNIRNALASKLNNNVNGRHSSVSHIPPFDQIKEETPKSTNVYQVRTENHGEALILIEGLPNAKHELKLHTYLNQLPLHFALQKASITSLRSGHKWGKIILFDFYCHGAEEISARSNGVVFDQKKAYDRRMVLTLMQEGYICIGGDGRVMQQETVEQLLSKNEI